MSENQELLHFTEEGYFNVISPLISSHIFGTKIELGSATITTCISQIMELVEGLVESFDYMADTDFVHETRFALRDVYALTIMIDICNEMDISNDN